MPFDSGVDDVDDVEKTKFALGGNLASLVVNKNPETPNPRKQQCEGPQIATDVHFSSTFDGFGDLFDADMDAIMEGNAELVGMGAVS